MHGTHDQRKRGAMSSAASEWVDGVRLIKSAIPMRVVAFFQAPTHLARLAQALLVGSLLNCQSGPIKPEGSSDTGGLTGAASATGSISSKTGAPGAAPLVVTLANGTTIRVPNGLRKKDTSARSLPPEIAQMQVFTWPGGDRLLSISEMLKDEKKGCATLLNDQWKQMKKSQAEEKQKPSGMIFEDTKVAKRRVLFFSGLQQGIYGAKQGRPKVATSTLTACEAGSLVLFAHASKKATMEKESRRLLFSLVSTMRSAGK